MSKTASGRFSFPRCWRRLWPFEVLEANDVGGPEETVLSPPWHSTTILAQVLFRSHVPQQHRRVVVVVSCVRC
jgi:hypothetical protein